MSESLCSILPYGIQVLGPLLLLRKSDKDFQHALSEVARLSKPNLQSKWQAMGYQEIDGCAASWNGELQILNASSLISEDYVTSTDHPQVHVFKSVLLLY